MRDLIKKIVYWLIVASFWVFVLSINVQGRTVFSYANEALVQNRFVQAIDQEMGDLWFKLRETARITFQTATKKQEKTR